MHCYADGLCVDTAFASPPLVSFYGGQTWTESLKIRINRRHSAFSLSLLKVTNWTNNDTYTYIVESVVIT